MKRVLQLQYTGMSIISIDEQGCVKMQSSVNMPGSAESHLHNQDTVILEPEEAYNLYHFLWKHRDFLKKFATVHQERRIETTLGVADYFSSEAARVQLDEQQLT